MRDYEFNYQQLTAFSQSDPYGQIRDEYLALFEELDKNRVELNFPAITNDVGSFISFMISSWKPKSIFEMGSGYGHSAFWYLLGDEGNDIESIVLTEKRDDLVSVFEGLPWPTQWKNKLQYNQADAFKVLESVESVDMALIDGVKGDYLKFLKELDQKTSKGAIVLIDNSYWRGSFLDDEIAAKKQSAKHIRELHNYIKDTQKWKACFLPFVDGLSILQKL